MFVQCERCKQEKDCEFHGRPANIEEDKVQNGEWLCEECEMYIHGVK